jgi:RNA polymerase sigma factor (sigma-70 family)
VRVRDPALPDDEALVGAFLKGELAAVRRVNAWIDSALRLHHGASLDSLDDLRQDARMRLVRNLRRGTFRRQSSLKTYVQRIAANAAIDAQRRALSRVEFQKLVGPLREGRTFQNNESAYIAGDMVRHLLRDLSRSDRLLIWLIFGERCSYAEAARRLGKSAGALKVRAHRCRRQLRDRFRDL